MASRWFNQGLLHFANAQLDWGNVGVNRIRALLTGSAFLIDTAGVRDAASLSAINTLDPLAEPVGGGYLREALNTTTAAALTGAPTNRVDMDSDDATLVFTNVTGTALTGMIIYHDAANNDSTPGTAGAGIPLFWFDDGFPLSPSASNITVTWNGNGLSSWTGLAGT